MNHGPNTRIPQTPHAPKPAQQESRQNRQTSPAAYAAGLLANMRASAQAHGYTPTQPQQPSELSAGGERSTTKRKGRDPVLVGEVYQGLLQTRGWQPALSTARLAALWPQIVGEIAAQHSYIADYQQGTVKIGTTNDNWAIQLRLLEPTIKAKIDAAVGDSVIENIVILPPRRPSQNRRWAGSR